VAGAHACVAEVCHNRMSQKSAHSLATGYHFPDGLSGLSVLRKRSAALVTSRGSHYLRFGTPPRAIRKSGAHRQCVRCTSQIRGMVRIGRDRGQHRPQLPCGTRQIGAADLLAHAGHRTPGFVPSNSGRIGCLSAS
jgi:hypothetical protein